MSSPNPWDYLDPRADSPDDYAAFHERAGHICCACPNQNPPLPCCNSGHDEATKQLEKFDQITGEA
jgi:hypothetical protein